MTSLSVAARRGWLRPGAGLSRVLLIVACVGCAAGAPEPVAPPTPSVTVAAVTAREITDFDEYTGRTEASEIVEIRSRIFGFLKTIDFKDGDFVKEGQTLFTIEPDEYQAIHEQSLAKIAVNSANLELSRSKLAMKEKLRPNGAISQEEYEEAVAAVHEAEATIAAAKADANRTAVDLKYTEIKAPISGRVDRALVSKGNLLTGGQSSGTLLTTIVNEQPMYVYFDVDERSLLRYMRQRPPEKSSTGNLSDQGVACFVQLADEKDFPHRGLIDFASAAVNASTGTARLRAVFENADHALASGLFVRIQIPVSKPYEALLIPERALSTDQNTKFVYVVGDDDVANRRVVELGRREGELRVITSGLSAGDRVIVKGMQRVKPGQKVDAEVEPQATTAAPSS
ncbi:efflux RND transporter periplasmic adaptor subunit [Lacipirellula sp.]|uniref:efflux RND transporter periplasmic adaptor subunit n=1 Tax=Lacipirellula sp. TaxID=2691419 RepID=UPI003D0E5A19